MDDNTIERMHCECGCDEFNVPPGIRDWNEHVVTCRKCGKQYRLMTLFIDNKKVSNKET